MAHEPKERWIRSIQKSHEDGCGVKSTLKTFNSTCYTTRLGEDNGLWMTQGSD